MPATGVTVTVRPVSAFAPARLQVHAELADVRRLLAQRLRPGPPDAQAHHARMAGAPGGVGRIGHDQRVVRIEQERLDRGRCRWGDLVQQADGERVDLRLPDRVPVVPGPWRLGRQGPLAPGHRPTARAVPAEQVDRTDAVDVPPLGKLAVDGVQRERRPVRGIPRRDAAGLDATRHQDRPVAGHRHEVARSRRRHRRLGRGRERPPDVEQDGRAGQQPAASHRAEVPAQPRTQPVARRGHRRRRLPRGGQRVGPGPVRRPRRRAGTVEPQVEGDERVDVVETVLSQIGQRLRRVPAEQRAVVGHDQVVEGGVGLRGFVHPVQPDELRHSRVERAKQHELERRLGRHHLRRRADRARNRSLAIGHRRARRAAQHEGDELVVQVAEGGARPVVVAVNHASRAERTGGRLVHRAGVRRVVGVEDRQGHRVGVSRDRAPARQDAARDSDVASLHQPGRAAGHLDP